ncbi:hypothetical protein EYF80_051392 [Liparis tanakae]|uniref:Uncharacterized protein n=1 Tax=Liparis tanakae TaxID=230148 RepID=A0A4Z2FBB4_9TELE|nr:hypothetical protein EYF80_051392 [Liparis tanakae]
MYELKLFTKKYPLGPFGDGIVVHPGVVGVLVAFWVSRCPHEPPRIASHLLKVVVRGAGGRRGGAAFRLVVDVLRLPAHRPGAGAQEDVPDLHLVDAVVERVGYGLGPDGPAGVQDVGHDGAGDGVEGKGVLWLRGGGPGVRLVRVVAGAGVLGGPGVFEGPGGLLVGQRAAGNGLHLVLTGDAASLQSQTFDSCQHFVSERLQMRLRTEEQSVV